MNKTVFKCNKCGKIMKEIYISGCKKCRSTNFITIFADEIRKKAMEIIYD